MKKVVIEQKKICINDVCASFVVNEMKDKGEMENKSSVSCLLLIISQFIFLETQSKVINYLIFVYLIFSSKLVN